MPPPGHSSITVSEEFFAAFDALYKWNKECGTLDPGICSFTSFFQQQLQEAINEKNSMRNFVSKILYVPEKFTETKLVLKQYKP